MRKKPASSKRASKRKDSKDRITIRGAKQVATDINKSHEKVAVENPIKRQVKLNQFYKLILYLQVYYNLISLLKEYYQQQLHLVQIHRHL